MTIQIKKLTQELEAEYQSFLYSVPTSLLYHSLQYRNFLREILISSEEHYLLALENEQIVAALPTFLMRGRFGSVVNSLPFYGSNGSIISVNGCSSKVINKLLVSFDEMCRDNDVVSSTIITNPLDNGKLSVDYDADIFDERIGQITPLPCELSNQGYQKCLMDSFHVKTRNLVRKGMKSGFEVSHDGSEQTMLQLYSLHQSNMLTIGGISKPWTVFKAVMKNFNYDSDYRVYTARRDGQLVAAILVFFFNQTAEYYTPVIHQDFRSDQPLSYLIFLAMQDSVKKHCKWWNWGGTWLSQEGVYHFKSRWGTEDHKYRYLVKFHSDSQQIRNRQPAEILQEYPFFYVLPFLKENSV